MNSIKKIIKASVLLLIVFTVACKDKDIPTHDDKHHVECTKKGTIIPLGCVGDYLGIMDSENKFYYIEKDLTNDFLKYKEGDEVCFDYEHCDISTADYSNQGINFVPATSINLKCIRACECNKCKPVKEVTELPTGSEPSQILNDLEMRQEGSTLYIKVAFSGCDSDIDPDLFVSLSEVTMGSGPGYNCILKEDRVQLCQAYFVKEVCFDISKLEKKHQSYELFFETREGSKSIRIAH